jgi:ABC-type multidrug transport system fused ATPase/permease subunit
LNLKQLNRCKNLALKAYAFVGASAARWMLLGIFGTLTLGFVELAIASFIQIFLRSLGLVEESKSETLFLLPSNLSISAIGGILIGLGVIRFLGQYMVNQSGVAAQEGINSRLRRILSYRILLHPHQMHVPASESNYLLGTVFQSASLAALFATLAFAHALQSAVLAIIMFLTSWREAVIGVVGLSLIGLLVLKLNRLIRNQVSQVPVQNRLLVSGIERVASNWLLVRTLRAQKIEYRRFTRSIASVLKHTLGAASLNNLAASGTPLLGIILLVVVVSVSQQYWNTSALVLLSFLYLFIRFVQGLAATVQLMGSVNQYVPQFREAARFFFSFSEEDISHALNDKRPSPSDTELDTRNLIVVSAPAPVIQFKNVSFAYCERPIIKNLSFELHSGYTLGVIGPSGCGKSTVLLLLLGILRPDKGNIKIGDVEATNVLQNGTLSVGYVGAEPFLFHGSVRDNLLYGLSLVTDMDIWRALERVKLSETIEKMPGQLDYLISENGDGLSAGQKQRLCIARVFLQEPSLLILDEATANLDSHTESVVIDSLAELKRKTTIVMVTHRLSALKHSDLILNLEMDEKKIMTSIQALNNFSFEQGSLGTIPS